MKYRTYRLTIIGALIISTLGIISCASTGDRKPDSVDDESVKTRSYDGREPASLKGDVTWLNEVEEDFGRIASETSNRAVASENAKEVLLQKKDWVFAYMAKTNHFYVTINGETFQMAQTSIGDGESYAFAAEGQSENPVTLSFVRSGRGVASGEGLGCNAELSYWNAKTHNYVKDTYQVAGKACEKLVAKLKDYVP